VLVWGLDGASQEQAKPQISRRKEKMNIRAEINEIKTETEITGQRIRQSWFFEKIRQTAKSTKKRDREDPSKSN
jgi:hypothetical protein